MLTRLKDIERMYSFICFLVLKYDIEGDTAQVAVPRQPEDQRKPEHNSRSKIVCPTQHRSESLKRQGARLETPKFEVFGLKRV